MSNDENPREATTGTRSAEGSIEIDAPIERVWRALTDATELERWFPLEARVEPGEGGSIFLSWKNEFAAESKILTWEPPHRLETSWGFGDEPAQVTEYELESRSGRTVLRVVTSGFPDDPTWDDWLEGTRKGWQFELATLKHYLERHADRDREVVYLRRRVQLSRDEAWARLFEEGGLPERPLGGEPFDVDPPRQYAAVVDDPAGAILRVSIEPSATGPEERDVTLWLSAWEPDPQRLAALDAEWGALLERLFPEGTNRQARRA